MDEAVSNHLRDKHAPRPAGRRSADRSLKSAFEQGKHTQSLAVRSPLEETAFAFEDREAIAAALSLFEAGSCGFADCLVVAKPARQGCNFTATFDRGMHKLPAVKVL
jgi:predicted nucleic-acid-binding protein